MTHEELLTKISDLGDNCLGIMAGAVMSDALRVVVELHKPFEVEGRFSKLLYCGGCYEEESGNYDYPCPTIQAIEKELA